MNSSEVDKAARQLIEAVQRDMPEAFRARIQCGHTIITVDRFAFWVRIRITKEHKPC